MTALATRNIVNVAACDGVSATRKAAAIRMRRAISSSQTTIEQPMAAATVPRPIGTPTSASCQRVRRDVSARRIDGTAANAAGTTKTMIANGARDPRSVTSAKRPSIASAGTSLARS